MDVPADQSARAVAQRIPPGTVRRARRRRPTGEAPPLPHHLELAPVRHDHSLLASTLANR